MRNRVCVSSSTPCATPDGVHFWDPMVLGLIAWSTRDDVIAFWYMREKQVKPGNTLVTGTETENASLKKFSIYFLFVRNKRRFPDTLMNSDHANSVFSPPSSKVFFRNPWSRDRVLYSQPSQPAGEHERRCSCVLPHCCSL